jgi:NADPH:quinone reductase
MLLRCRHIGSWGPEIWNANRTGSPKLPSVAGNSGYDCDVPMSMRAVVLESAPAPPEALKILELPVPTPKPGQVLINVKAFGLNRSELHSRTGLAEGMTFPRVLGIEATGVVAAAPGGEFTEGQQVMTMLGGMGRQFDGGYAEYTCVPVSQVIPFTSLLSWDVLGAVPEMLQTAYGSLTIGVDAQPGQTLLIRGGTSSVGRALTVLAKDIGLTVLATTRQPDRLEVLRKSGVDVPLIDGGTVADAVREHVPGGVDGAIELVGSPTLRDTLRATRVHGTVCMIGMLSNSWVIPDFSPVEFIPSGVRLTGYAGNASNLPADVLQGFLDAVAEGRLRVPVDRVYTLDEIADAHADMEAGRATGKLVVIP